MDNLDFTWLYDWNNPEESYKRGCREFDLENLSHLEYYSPGKKVIREGAAACIFSIGYSNHIEACKFRMNEDDPPDFLLKTSDDSPELRFELTECVKPKCRRTDEIRKTIEKESNPTLSGSDEIHWFALSHELNNLDSPTKQLIWNLLDDDTRLIIRHIDVEGRNNEDEKNQLISSFRSLIKDSNLCLEEEEFLLRFSSNLLLQNDEVSDAERRFLNRELLNQVFPRSLPPAFDLNEEKDLTGLIPELVTELISDKRKKVEEHIERQPEKYSGLNLVVYGSHWCKIDKINVEKIRCTNQENLRAFDSVWLLINNHIIEISNSYGFNDWKYVNTQIEDLRGNQTNYI